MNKQEMIDLLVSNEGPSTRRTPRRPDFDKLPERLLRRELQFRGLIEFDEPEIFDEDAAGVSGDELNALISGARRSRLDNHFFD